MNPGKRRRFFYITVAAVVIMVVVFTLNSYIGARAGLRGLRADLDGMVALRAELQSLRDELVGVEGRSTVNVQGAVQAVDEVFMSLGLKKKIKSVKPAGTKQIKGGIEEEAEVQVEKATMNELVNIFYKIENAPAILVVKRANIKKTFENPELFNLTITISLIRTEGVGGGGKPPPPPL